MEVDKSIRLKDSWDDLWAKRVSNEAWVIELITLLCPTVVYGLDFTLTIDLKPLDVIELHVFEE